MTTTIYFENVDLCNETNKMNIEDCFYNKYLDFFTLLCRPYDFDNFIKQHFSCKNNNKFMNRVFYHYFKFLLNDIDNKNEFNENFIKKVNSIEKITDSTYTDKKFSSLLNTMNYICNQSNCNEFFEFHHNYSTDIELRLNNNVYCGQEKYITLDFFNKFKQFVYTYDRLLFINQCIYFYSDIDIIIKNNYTNSFDDFESRFEYSLSYLCRMNSLLRINNEITSLHTYLDISNKYFKSSLIDNDELMEALQREKFYEIVFNEKQTKTVEFINRFNYYLKNVMKYDIQLDNYRLYQLVNEDCYLI